MLHKLRLAMRKRDEPYKLSAQIESDEGFFSTEIAPDQKNKSLKRGRGSQKKSKVLVMAENQKIRLNGKQQKKENCEKWALLKCR